MAVDRYGKLLAFRFFSSFGATVFETDFKQIDYYGVNSRIWSEIITKDNNNARAQLLPYMIEGPVKKGEDKFPGQQGGLLSRLPLVPRLVCGHNNKTTSPLTDNAFPFFFYILAA